MPRGDRTGPVGMGPMTGRGAGYCAGFGRPGFAGPRGGFFPGFAGGGFRARCFRGGGRGWWRPAYAPGFGAAALGFWPAPYQKPDAAEVKQALENQATALESELEFIRKRLSDLEREKETQ